MDNHDLSVIDAEARAIRELAKTDFRLIAVKVDSWNHDLSPWKADAVFGNADFGDGAQDTLKEILINEQRRPLLPLFTGADHVREKEEKEDVTDNPDHSRCSTGIVYCAYSLAAVFCDDRNPADPGRGLCLAVRSL